MRWTERFWKKLQRRVDELDEDGRTGIHHSTSYHSFFQGYSERKVGNQNGFGYRIERIYTADYYRYGQSDRAWKWYKVLYILLFLAGAAATFFAQTRDSALNHVGYIGAAEMLSYITMLYVLYLTGNQVLAHRLMTVGEYELVSLRLQKGALVCGGCLAVITVLMLIYVVMHRESASGAEALCMICQGIGSVCFWLLYGIEARRGCDRVKNNAETNENANEIW